MRLKTYGCYNQKQGGLLREVQKQKAIVIECRYCLDDVWSASEAGRGSLTLAFTKV